MKEICFLSIHTHPPAKDITKKLYLPNFLKIFFQILKTFVYVVVWTPPSDNPTHDSEGWG